MQNDFRPRQRPTPPIQTSDSDDDFRTPEAVAAAEDLTPSPITPSEKPVAPSGWRAKLSAHWPPTKKQSLLAGLVGLLLIGGLVFALGHHSQKAAIVAPPKPVKKVVPKPTTVPSTLSGLPVDPSVNQRPVTAVMIENSTDARPQSGLGQASVVFEAIAEGGITRFLALFQDTAPTDVGPIRSARPYYVQWAMGFDAGYAHVGGSPEALQDIKAWGVHDLDQFANGGSYHRISSRAAPHNVYTAVSTLNQLETSKGLTTSSFTGFTRKKDAPVKVPTAKTINLSISGPLYNVHYDYDVTTNSYARSEGGAPHIDANTNTQIRPKVVVALVMPYGLEADDHHSSYGTIGSGAAYFFQDGTVTTGQWAKTDNTSQFVFTDSAGQPMKLNAGQTWLTALGTASAVTSAP